MSDEKIIQLFMFLAPFGWIVTIIEWKMLTKVKLPLIILRIMTLNLPTIVVILESMR